MPNRLLTFISLVALIAAATSCLEASPPQEAPSATGPRESSNPPAQPDPPQRDPEAVEVLERSLAAMGGRAMRDGIVSTRSSATLRMENNRTDFQLLERGEDKFIVRHAIQGLGQMEIGFDGRSGWRCDPPDRKVTPISAREAAEFRRTFDFQALVRNLDRRFSNARIQPAETIDSVSCDVLLLEESDERLKVYFDQATGLIKAFEVVVENDRKRRRVVIESWSKEANPMRWVRQLRIEQPRNTLEAIYTSVTFDDVADATFEAPPEIVVPEGVQGE